MSRGKALAGGLADDASASRSGVSVEEHLLVDALRRGDERAFVALIERFHTSLLRMATIYCPDRAVAEELVQETWLGVLKGIQRFEARSSLKTWIFSILIHQARTRARKEARTVSFSAMARDCGIDFMESAAAENQFLDGRWQVSPESWGPTAEERVLALEVQEHLRRAIAALPLQQRTVLTLRDVEGWTSEEVCNVLHLAKTNQRVHLHRARCKVRRVLADYLA